MPVRVDIPTRIRVDPVALVQRRETLEEALAAASLRALAASREVVLSERGGYVGVRLHRPVIAWTGDGLTQVPAALRAEIEEILERTLGRGADEAGLFAVAGEADDLDDPLMAEPAERFDRRRYASLAQLYALPAYDDEGNRTPIDVISFEGDIVVAGRETFRVAWQSFQTAAQMLAALRQAIREGRIAVPAQGQFGTIFRAAGKVFVIVFQMPGFQVILDIEITGLAVPTLQGSGADARFTTEPTELPADATYRLGGFVRTNSDAERQAVLRELLGRLIELVIRANVEQIFGQTSRSEIDSQIADKVDLALGQVLEGMPELQSATGVYRLTVNGVPYPIATFGEVPTNIDAELVPLTDVVEIGEEEAAGGEGGGAGAGQRGAGTVENGTGGQGGEGGEGGGEPGGIVYTGEEGMPSDQPTRLFPASRYTSYGTLDCSPVAGEPPLEDLGADGERLRRLIGEIAEKLQIVPCEHAARFCVNAAAMIGSRVVAVAAASVEEEGLTQPAPEGRGNLGLLQFAPTSSPAIQFMRHLAGVVPLIERLEESTSYVIGKPEHRGKISGFRQNEPIGWRLDFLKELTPVLDSSVGWLFAQTCRVLMLQLLRTSKKGIDGRLRNIDAYAPLFERLVLTQLTDISELQRLKRELAEALSSGGALAVVGSAVYSTWREARRGVLDLFEGRDPFASAPSGTPGEIVRQGDRVVGIRDEGGRLWTMTDLDSALAIKEGTAEAIDPLVSQLIQTPETMDRFRRDRTAIRTELHRMLLEMQANNNEITGKVESSPIFAFRASKISKNIPEATVPYTSYVLGGIHLQAHQEVGEFFRGSAYYARGINYLFAVELGREGLLAFFEFTGIVLLSILCPPAGFVAGLGAAAYHHAEARERVRVFESLLDPDAVASRAEIEAELFAAELGLALSFIPGAGRILRTGATGVRVVARRGVTQGARTLTRMAQRRITRQVMEQLRYGLVIAMAREFAEEQVEDLVIEKLLIGPAIDQLYLEFGQVKGGATATSVPLTRTAASRQDQ